MLFDSTSLALIMAVKLIEINDANKAAEFIYNQVELSINKDDEQDEKSRVFWEVVIGKLSDIDGAYAVNVAEEYLKIVMKTIVRERGPW